MVAMFVVDLDIASALARPRRCPTCASDRLTPVTRDGVVTFRCHECRRVWACVLGTFVRTAERPDDRHLPGLPLARARPDEP